MESECDDRSGREGGADAPGCLSPIHTSSSQNSHVARRRLDLCHAQTAPSLQVPCSVAGSCATVFRVETIHTTTPTDEKDENQIAGESP
jgi:hypothetical protein